ncbi:MAG: Hpt domain-containing protein [Spirochaetales bacterium]|nr:Hpt domain-containing protein [Spirochaetales bacterium]
MADNLPLNAEKAARLLDGNKDLYRELIKTVETTLPERLDRLQKALTTHNSEDLEMYAHQLKGALRAVAADEACALLEQLEICGKQADFLTAAPLWPSVEPTVQRFLGVFRTEAWISEFTRRSGI